MKKKHLTLFICASLIISAIGALSVSADNSDEAIEPIWIETFDNPVAYGDTDKYTASVLDGVLTLQAKNDTHRDTYTLSKENEALSGKTKLTFAINFKLDSLHTSGSIFASYGHSENKAYIAGFQRLNGYAYLVHGKAEEGTTKGTLTTTQRFIKTDNSSAAQNVPFPATDVCTMIVEVDGNASSVCTMYVNGVKTGVAGDFRGNNYKKYDASSDTEKTMDGSFGLLVPTDDTVIKIGTYAIYDGTGLDHDIIKQQVYNTADFGVAEDSNTEEADRGELLFIESFDGNTLYADTDKYTASVSEGVLRLQAKNDAHRDVFVLSDEQDALTGRTKLTFAFNFTLESLHTSGSIFASFGHSENKAYLAGIQSINGAAYLVHGKAVEGEASGTLTTTQRHIVTPFSDGSPSSNGLEFPESEELAGVYTVVIEVDNNEAKGCSVYKNGILVGVAGELRSGANYQKYNAAADTAKTMNGHFGMLVPTQATSVNIGTYAIYSGIGLDHSDVIKQVYDTEDFGGVAPSIPSTPPSDGDIVITPPLSDNTDTEPTDIPETDDNGDSTGEPAENDSFWTHFTTAIIVVIGVAIAGVAITVVVAKVVAKKEKGKG